MKAGGLRRALQTAVLAVLIPATGFADEVQEKLEYCKNCHGDKAQGFQGYYTAPRLAGQPVQYLENQFEALAKHRRDNPIAQQFMWPGIEAVPLGLRAALAKQFNELNPPPADGGPRNFVSAGRSIYDKGIPDENVPACAACHGEDAHGSNQVPRLAGQMYAYTVEQLVGWGKGFRRKDPVLPGETNTMQSIAAGMTKDQIRAVAAYLSYQR
jgi:cytochrome c553